MLYLTSILSVFLLAGIVSQAIGFYLTFLVVPFAIYWRKELNREIQERLRQLAFGFFLMWVIFPLSNLYNYMRSDTAVELPFKVLMKSHFSSCLLITAVFVFLYSFKDWARPKTTRSLPRLELQAPPSTTFLKPFLKGLFLSSFVLCFYLFFQQTWGMDFLGNVIPENRRMGGGLFRVSGFYSHPLTLAGVGLAFFGFAGSLLTQKEFSTNRSHLVGILITSAYFVFASGGRAASLLVIAFGLFLFIINYLRPKKGHFRSSKPNKNLVIKIGLSIFAFIFCFVVLEQMGLLTRFTNLYTMPQTESDRFIFWRVHWRIFLDHPWFGQGLALLNAFKRNEYYELMGYANLHDKYAAHNMILEVLSTVGILGTLVMGFGFFKVCKAVLNSGYRNQIYVKALFVSFVLNVLNGFTQNVFFDTSVLYIYLSLTMLILWGDINDSLKESPRHHQLVNRQTAPSSQTS